MKVALFDFDGTLFPLETLPFLFKQWKEQNKSRFRYCLAMSRFLPVYLLYSIKVISSSKMRYTALLEFTKMFNGMLKEEIDDFFKKSYEKVKPKIDKIMIKEIERLVGENYFLILVSGAFKPFLEQVAKDLEFNDAIGTEMHIHNGCFTFDKESFKYINGEQKVVEVLEMLKEKSIDWENSYAYADSYSDVAMMELVGNAVAVRPDRDLLETAKRKQWKVID